MHESLNRITKAEERTNGNQYSSNGNQDSSNGNQDSSVYQQQQPASSSQDIKKYPMGLSEERQENFESSVSVRQMQTAIEKTGKSRIDVQTQTPPLYSVFLRDREKEHFPVVNFDGSYDSPDSTPVLTDATSQSIPQSVVSSLVQEDMVGTPGAEADDDIDDGMPNDRNGTYKQRGGAYNSVVTKSVISLY